MRTVVLFALLALMPASGATAQSANDKAMADRISSHLQQSGQLHNYRIGITYKDGVAVLAGSVANTEQRDTAVRLARNAPGVKNVVCQLQYPGAPQNPGASQSAVKPQRNMAGGMDQTRVASAQSGPSRVVHAYDENDAANAPRQRTNNANRSPMMRRMPGPPRRNMPLPSPRPGLNPGIRQVSAQGMNPAGGMCPDGSCGPMMDGGMYGPNGDMGIGETGTAAPMGFVPQAYGRGPSYENARMPGYAWPSYAAYPNYAALTYPRQYSPTAWPYIGPFYPYPQVPLAWRKVSLEWDDGWWFLDFSAHNSSH